jgi:hypothetical protein
MGSFASRHGYQRDLPDRDVVEEAPQRLRSLLHESLLREFGAVGAYRKLCKQAGIVPERSVLSWGAKDALPEVAGMVDYLDWIDVFELLEELARTRDLDPEEVNEAFIRCGLAYEMKEEGEIHLWDPEGAELGVAGDEYEPLEVLDREFKPARKQYQRALKAIHGRPSDPEKAISEAFGALEAVGRIATGERTFARAVDALFNEGEDWTKALVKSINALHGYASQLPGARHGRHRDAALDLEEALYVVRACGAAIAYIAYRHRAS